jgi:hypothetical protein
MYLSVFLSSCISLSFVMYLSVFLSACIYLSFFRHVFICLSAKRMTDKYMPKE